ncbi:hypothetical protein D3C76_1027410 [compost metagenome]
MTTAERTRRAPTPGTGRRWISLLARVSARGDGLLEFFHIGELRLTGRRCLRRIDLRRLVNQQLRGHRQAAVTAQGQFGTILQMHGHRTGCPRLQLLAGKQPVTFGQHPTCPVIGDGEDLSDYFADNTD